VSRAQNREPLEFAPNGTRILTHNASGYRRGCRCDACTAAKTQANRDRDSSADQILTHNIGGYARGCRCDICKAAKTEYMASQRGAAGTAHRRMPAEDSRKNPRSGKFSDAELDLVDRAALQAGMPRAAYIREAVLMAAAEDLDMTEDELEALDTARRPTRRRRNYSERAAKEQVQ
jgi:hypothetical protein